MSPYNLPTDPLKLAGGLRQQAKQLKGKDDPLSTLAMEEAAKALEFNEQAIKLAQAVAALRAIYAGASATGRWYDSANCTAVGHDEDGPEAGYYDQDEPPDGYDSDGYCGFDDDRPDPADPLRPCEWENYTLEEQNEWLETCAHTAKIALEGLGVPLTEEPTDTPVAGFG